MDTDPVEELQRGRFYALNTNEYVSIQIPNESFYLIETNNMNKRNLKYISTKQFIKTSLKICLEVVAFIFIYKISGIKFK